MSRISAHPSSSFRWLSWLSWLSLAGRLIGAAIFGWAALSKIGDPAATARAVRAYQLLPEAVVGPVTHALPAFELVLAGLLLVGVAVRVVGLVAASAMAVFIAAVSSAGLRGLRIDCGCFGGGGATAQTHYLLDIGRDVVLLLVLAVVARAPSSQLSVERWLDRRVQVRDPGVRRARLATARAAAAAATRRRQRTLAGVAAAACLVGAAIGGNMAATTATTAIASTAAPMAVPAGATSTGGIWVGSATAPTQIIAYEDPQCPICGAFEKTNGRTLQAAVAAGKVRVEYWMRSFLGPESARAVNALAAAQDEGRFGALHAAIYANQPEEHSGGFSTATLLELGQGVGLDDAAFTDAVQTMKYARWVAFVDASASRAGNVGTPEIIRSDGHVLNQQQTFDPSAFAAALNLA